MQQGTHQNPEGQRVQELSENGKENRQRREKFRRHSQARPEDKEKRKENPREAVVNQSTTPPAEDYVHPYNRTDC